MSGRRPFAIPGARPHYAPDLPFKLEHIFIDVAIDPVGRKLSGTVTQRVRPVSPGQSSIRLDQVGLNIEEARVGGKSAPFAVEGHSLRVSLPSQPAPGEALELSVRYSVENPRRGLYFTGPDAAYPLKPHQVWSQGQDEDNRYWIPSFDYPNQKATSEVIATVPKGYTAVSNGALVSRKEEGERSCFHYRLGTPHVTYLITLVVAELSAWEDKGPRGLPVQYFVAPGREEDGKRAFGNTPKMIEAFEQATGVPYPYEKYSQVAVQDFIFGGMENTSATTQTDLTLHDARAHLDFSSDPLVSHELAHQWFGDLLTCRDWSHGWLNEGFATFMERVWIERNAGPGGGWDEAKYYSYMDLKEHMQEDAHSYRRPIVCNTYIEPIDLFDTHLYQKGGLVLNLIRYLLGAELFWKSVQLYVTRHRGQNVETLDLIRAIEDATGRNLRRVFDEWVFGGGYPELELSYEWHEDKKLAEIVIEQKQTRGQPTLTEEGATTHLFHLPVVIELTLEGDRKISQRIEIGEARDRIFLAAEGKPLMVRFDPENWIPKTMKFPRPKEMLLYQLAHDSDCMGRIEAAQELGREHVRFADREILEALGKAASSDRFWGVQVEAAEALALARSEFARDALISALGTRHPKARRGIVHALGSFRDPVVSQALRKLAEKDESYYVEAEATQAMTVSGFKPVPKPSEDEIQQVEAFLLKQLGKDSYREVIRAGALRSLAELPGISRGERPKALAALIDWTRAGHPLDARMAAISSLGRVAGVATPAEKARAHEVLSHLALEDNFRIRMVLIGALRATESPEAIAVLDGIYQADLDGRVRRTARVARDELQTAGSTPESVANLKGSLEKLEEEYRKLKAMLEEVRAEKKPTSPIGQR